MTADRPRPAAIFVNEGAGSAHSHRVRRAIELTQRALNAERHVTSTRDAAELEAWMRERLDGYATAHLLRMPGEPEAMAATIARADARRVDLMAVGDRLALFAGAGWDALVARRYADEGAHRLAGWARAVIESTPDLFRRRSVRVTADDRVVHEGPMQLLVVGTTPFYGRGLHVNPGARPDIGQLTLRVYAGPAPSLALEAVRWAARRRPRAEAHRAASVRLETLDGRPLAVQADGDALGDSGEWRFEVRPRAVNLIGRW